MTTEPSAPFATPKPTQIKFPGRAVARTVVAALIATIAVVNAALPIILDTVNRNFTGRIVIVVNSIAVTITVITGAITRIMAIPQVNEWLRSLKLSATK